MLGIPPEPIVSSSRAALLRVFVLPYLALLTAFGAPDSSAPADAPESHDLTSDELPDEEMERLEALGDTGGEVVWDFIAPM